MIFCPELMGKNDNDVVYIKGDGNYETNESLDKDGNSDGKIQYSEIRFRLTPSLSLGLSNKALKFECSLKQSDNETNSDGVLEEMKKLVDKNIPYSQLGERGALSEAGLKNLDCSETVGIYLHKLGIMPVYKAIDTSTLTNEDNFRTTIGSNNIDFIVGSDKKDFKPQRGDVFVWRRNKKDHGKTDGHTGIVYNYDETTDIVTILEAIGDVGAVSETDQVKNGGYSGTGCSRTAKYKRLKGALYGHEGWKGFFRPKNYTKKL